MFSIHYTRVFRLIPSFKFFQGPEGRRNFWVFDLKWFGLQTLLGSVEYGQIGVRTLNRAAAENRLDWGTETPPTP